MAVTFLTGIDLNGQRGQNAADPQDPTDLVTRQYVDARIQGLHWKQPVRVATTTDGTLATAYAAGESVDGVTLETDDRILIKDQTDATENGIYVVGAWAPSRAPDADSTEELHGAAVYVTSGTTNADLAFTQTTDEPVIGTDDIVWAQFGGGSLPTAGAGLQLSGSTLSVGEGLGISVGADDVAIDTSVVTRHYTTTVGDGTSTSIEVAHGLSTQAVDVALVRVSDGARVETDWGVSSVNTVTLAFPTPPTTGQYRVTVMG